MPGDKPPDYEQRQAFGGVIDILEAVGAEYMIWGGVAVSVYGEPRFTQDMDVVARLTHGDVRLMAKALQADHYHISVSSALNAIGGGFFNVIHLPFNIKIDFWLPESDPLMRWAFEHAQTLEFSPGRQARFMPPEAVILFKLRAYRESNSTRHTEDVAGIVRVSGDTLDAAFLDVQAAQMGEMGLWRSLWEANRPG